jgi:hypothetical protein
MINELMTSFYPLSLGFNSNHMVEFFFFFGKNHLLSLYFMECFILVIVFSLVSFLSPIFLDCLIFVLVVISLMKLDDVANRLQMLQG